MIVVQACGCGTGYDLPMGVPVAAVTCPSCHAPAGSSVGGSFVFLADLPGDTVPGVYRGDPWRDDAGAPAGAYADHLAAARGGAS